MRGVQHYRIAEVPEFPLCHEVRPEFMPGVEFGQRLGELSRNSSSVHEQFVNS